MLLCARQVNVTHHGISYTHATAAVSFIIVIVIIINNLFIYLLSNKFSIRPLIQVASVYNDKFANKNT